MTIILKMEFAGDINVTLTSPGIVSRVNTACPCILYVFTLGETLSLFFVWPFLFISTDLGRSFFKLNDIWCMINDIVSRLLSFPVLTAIISYNFNLEFYLWNNNSGTSVIKYVNIKLCNNTDLCSGGSRNLKEVGGGGRKYLRKWITNCINIVCWLQLKYMHTIQSKFTKTSWKKFKRSVSPGSAFALWTFWSLYRDAVLGTVRK